MKEFKCRSSATGKVMTNGKTGVITPKQLEMITTLEGKEKLTDKQAETLKGLKVKRDTPPQMGDTGKTYCVDWLKEQLYGKRKEFTSKYTHKGNEVEEQAIDWLADLLDTGLIFKNDEYFENDFVTGTPDLILDSHDLIVDIKSSWDCFTFPLFSSELPNKDYYWQMQSYMWLTGKNHSMIAYCLMDTPEEVIEAEAYRQSLNEGFMGTDDDVLEKVREKHSYSNIEPALRLKTFQVERNEEDIEKIKNRVIECRKYIDNLKNKIKW